MPEVPAEVEAQFASMLVELRRRASRAATVNSYYGEAKPPSPEAVVRARMTKAYRTLMPMATAPWGTVVVDTTLDRLEVAGVRSSSDQAAADAVWRCWRENAMPAESKLAHNSALLHGRVFLTVWPGEDGEPEISLDSAEQVVVMYREGSRNHRVAALRHWVDDRDMAHAVVYRPEGLYKFRQAREQNAALGRFEAGELWWEVREVDGEAWPLENPYGVVTVVEAAVNRRLKSGAFPFARGEFEHCLGLLDRINLLTFLGLVVALWMGFPLRGVIGAKILRDDEDNPIAPFDADADKAFQIENPDAKLAEFKAADRGNLSVFPELDQLAFLTKTPAHYFPLEQGMSNLSADAIRALEGGLHAKVTGHKASLGEAHEETLRLCGLMLDPPVELPRDSEILWKEHEFRSLAERADAASKLLPVFPWQVVAERVMNATQDEIVRWTTLRAEDALSELAADASGRLPEALRLALAAASSDGTEAP